MSVEVLGVILAAIAALGVLMFSPSGDRQLHYRVAAVWVGSAVAAFLVPFEGGAFFAIAVLLIVAAPTAPADRVRLFLATFFALPSDFHVRVPFPGLNYLIDLNLGLLSALILLTPVLISRLGRPSPGRLFALDAVFLSYVLLVGVLSLRDLPLTSMLRVIVNQFLVAWLPYYAITRTTVTSEDLQKMLLSLFQGFAMLAAIGILSTVRSYNFYAPLFDGFTYKLYADYRGGILRISATLFTPLLAVLMGVGAAIAMHLRSVRMLNAWIALGYVGAFALVAFVTGARGGWLGAIAAAAVFPMLLYSTPMLRRLGITAAAVGTLVFSGMIVNDGLALKDEYGTFDYRTALMQIGVEQVKERPLFGAPKVTELPAFKPLVQGEGIVDLVNLYLQIALYNGLIGLGVFLLANLLALSAGFRALAQTDHAHRTDRDKRTLRSIIAVLIAAQAGMLVMAFTTSAESYLLPFMFVFVALIASTGTVARVLLEPRTFAPATSAPVAAPQDGIAGPPPASPNPRGPLPYGARFVRRN